MDLDTFLTTLYVLVDDWYKSGIAQRMERHAGPEVQMSDSEVLTVALAGQWRVGVPWQSERGVVRYMQAHGRAWFPRMLSKSAFNQRVRQLWSALVCLQQLVANQLDDPTEVYESVDIVPLPACSLAQAASGDGHWLWWSELGYGGNQGGWYWGEQLLTSVSASGVVTGWLLGPAAVDDRWLMQAFVSARAGALELVKPPADKKHTQAPPRWRVTPVIAAGHPVPRPYLADQGFNGDRWRRHWWVRYGVTVITIPPTHAPQVWTATEQRWLSSHRQIVETVFARLIACFGLKQLRAHSRWGQLTRIAAKMAAYNIGLFLNRSLGRPDGALETLIC